jgi:hypothetical protein
MAGEFSALVDSKLVGSAVLGFQRAIERSFVEDHGPQTQAEIKRRFDICARVFRVLRGDLKWSVTRILDHLPRYLRCELDGQPWKPDASTIWTPPGIAGT